MYLSVLSAAGVLSLVSPGRKHTYRVTPGKGHHRLSSLMENLFPFDFGAQVQIADKGDCVQTQRQQEESQENHTAALTSALLAARTGSRSERHFVREINRGGTIACHYRTERGSRAPYLGIISASADAFHLLGDS